MIERFLMIKKKYRYIGGAVLLGIVCLVILLIFLNKPDKPASISNVIIVPTGQTTFTIDMDINEDTPYAGIEFALTLSDESALEFVSFTPSLEEASTSPFMSKDGLYYFGFFTLTGANMFPAGETLAGTLDFTGYTGNQDVTVSVVQMNVIRVNEEKKAITTEKDSPSYIFTVKREADK